ncbi:uncharacterized protein LOC113272629 [Papaver somniferum]|uniref:uncharacterized protein LOC113272629 n=1 Tax=Papaver somniferum TaxID=3469 RepID=UPI000E6F61C3|nr:uncharacterized protein LOC113272629 [Papaver somniferum]
MSDDQNVIKSGIVDFFKNIFQEENHARPNMDGMNFNSIPDDMCAWLEGDIDEDKALNAIKKNKEPRFFGLEIEEYVYCLNPREDIVDEIKDLRPVSLINRVYKILSKVLAERFKVYLPHVISQQQSTFVKQRQILDGVLIANELIDSIRKSGIPGLLCKIDFEKAFDHVNWRFLVKSLEKMGFSNKWRRCIQCCVEHVRFSVLVNGSAKGYFKSDKGESLTAMIHKSQVDGHLNGFKVSEMELTLRINFSKSHLYAVGDAGDMSTFTSLLGCYNSILPTSYLGLPLGDKYKGIHKWDNAIDRFISKLDGCKRPLLTRAGKIVLIKSVLSSLPIYYMLLFEFPKSVEVKLERIMKNFLWHDNKGNRKLHLVKLNSCNDDLEWLSTSKKKFSVMSSYEQRIDIPAIWRGLIILYFDVFVTLVRDYAIM